MRTQIVGYIPTAEANLTAIDDGKTGRAQQLGHPVPTFDIGHLARPVEKDRPISSARNGFQNFLGGIRPQKGRRSKSSDREPHHLVQLFKLRWHAVSSHTQAC